MKKLTLSLVTAVALLSMANAGVAACYADYKAKRDGPLQLHYGVMELPDRACGSRRAAAAEIAPRLARGGWTLLNVLEIFDGSRLGEKQASAGQYFLRY